MGVGSGAGDTLRVDPEMLSQLGSQLETSARALPEAPAPFAVTGDDAISAAIAARLPALETPIIEGLPAVKEAAAKTASNIVAAAGKYQGTDEELAAAYEKQQFGGGGAGGAAGGAAGAAGSAGAGAAGAGGGAMGQMGQLMSMPMQMASQAAQMPQQVMGAMSQVPQAGMQGAQQIVQMATGAGKDAGSTPEAQAAQRERDECERERDEAAGGKHRERAPIDEAPVRDSAVPDGGAGPRHAAPDTSVDL
jgi:hypothetical protein